MNELQQIMVNHHASRKALREYFLHKLTSLSLSNVEEDYADIHSEIETELNDYEYMLDMNDLHYNTLEKRIK